MKKNLLGAMLALVLLVVAAPVSTAQVVYHHPGGGTSTWTPHTNSALVMATPAGTSPADPTLRIMALTVAPNSTLEAQRV